MRATVKAAEKRWEPEGKRANFHVTTAGRTLGWIYVCICWPYPVDISESKVAKGNMKNALNLLKTRRRGVVVWWCFWGGQVSDVCLCVC